MKILYISHLHPPQEMDLENTGGMQRVSQQFVSELGKRKDIQLNTIILQSSWNWIALRTFLFLFKNLFAIKAQVKKNKPDVILFSSMVTAGLAYFIRKQIDVPMVCINHGQDVTLPFLAYQWFLPKVFKNLDGSISVSKATREETIKRGMDPEKSVALPNGFSSEELNYEITKEEGRDLMKNELKYDLNGKNVLLTVGRHVKRKGHEWFINNVLPLINSDFIYIIIGDGPEFAKIKEAVDKSPNKENIILAGKQPDKVLRYAYAASDLFIMPNIKVPGDMEGFGIVILEANIAKTPAIASDMEGIKDVVKQGKNGYRITIGSSHEFAAKIDEVLHNELMTLSESSKKYVMNDFSWSNVLNDYLGFLETVIKRTEQGQGIRNRK
ncbi:MAG: glycosyltransferase family 4 protein [Balneolales bacterium]